MTSSNRDRTTKREVAVRGSDWNTLSEFAEYSKRCGLRGRETAAKCASEAVRRFAAAAKAEMDRADGGGRP